MTLTSPPYGGTPPDDDLVALLTTTLAAQAETVQDGPTWTDASAASATTGRPPIRIHSTRARRWLPPLAAAVAVAAVVAAVVFVEQRPQHATPPAPATHDHSTGPTSPTSPASTAPSTGSTTSSAPPVPAAATCPAKLPAAWSNAFASGLVNVGGAYAYPMSVSANGTLVIYRDNGVTPGSPRQILLVPPGQAGQVVYQLQNPDLDDVQSAYLVGHKLVVALGIHGRAPKGTEPGDSPMPNVTSLLVLNLVTHEQRTIATAGSATNSPAITEAVVLGHTVYWDLRRRYLATTGTVHAYDLNTGTGSTVYTGPIGYPAASAAGIGWFEKHGGYQVHVSAPLPSVVAGAVPANELLTVGTDGTAYAWLQSPSVVGWWAPGAAKPTYRQLPHRVQLPDSFPDVLVVSGSFVYPGNGDLLDMKTGAMVSLGDGNLGSFTHESAAPISRGTTVIATAEQPGNGGFVNGYWEDPQTVVLRIDTGHLPGLHC